MGMMGRGGLGAGGMAGPNLAVADAGGRVLASRTGELVGETLPQSVIAQGVPILVSGRQVGTLLNIHASDMVLDPQAQTFLSRVRTSLLWARSARWFCRSRSASCLAGCSLPPWDA